MLRLLTERARLRVLHGAARQVGQRGAGECCGETACLANKPRNSTVTCVSDEDIMRSVYNTPSRWSTSC